MGLDDSRWGGEREEEGKEPRESGEKHQEEEQHQERMKIPKTGVWSGGSQTSPEV